MCMCVCVCVLNIFKRTGLSEDFEFIPYQIILFMRKFLFFLFICFVEVFSFSEFSFEMETFMSLFCSFLCDCSSLFVFRVHNFLQFYYFYIDGK